MFAKTRIEVVLEMPFLIFANADIRFAKRMLVWRSYTAAEALLTTKRVELIKKKEFVAAALNEDKKTFAVHVASSLKPANLSRDAQITSLNAEKAPDAVPSEYSNYVDVFLLGSTAEILEHNSIGDYAIDLVDGKQPPFGQIYSLGRWS